MPLLSVIFALVVLGLIWYLVNTIPLPSQIKIIIHVLFVIILIYIVLGLFGIGDWGSFRLR